MSFAFSDHFVALMSDLETFIESPGEKMSEEKRVIIQLREELMSTFSGDINEYYLYFHLLWRLETLVETPKISRDTFVIQTIFNLLHKQIIGVDFFQRAIRSKNSHLLAIAGMLYQYGYPTVDEDINQAKVFYEKAIEWDDSALAFLLDIYNHKGQYDKIEPLVKRALKSSDPRVQTWYANSIQDNFNSTDEDKSLAAVLCKKAMSKNYPMAFTALAGIDLIINHFHASELLEQAAKMGDPVAIIVSLDQRCSYEKILLQQDGRDNRLRVLSLYQQAQKFSGLYYAPENLLCLAYVLSFENETNNKLKEIDIYINLVKKHITYQNDQVFAYLKRPYGGGFTPPEWLDEAIKLGHVDASLRRAFAYERSAETAANPDENYQKAIELLRLPLELNDPEAIMFRAQLCLEGKGEPEKEPNYDAALEWFDRGIALGLSDAMLAKAAIYSDRGNHQAAKFYRMAIILQNNRCYQRVSHSLNLLETCAQQVFFSAELKVEAFHFHNESQINIWRYHYAFSNPSIKLDFLKRLYENFLEDFLNLLSQDELISIPEKIALLQELKIIKTLSFPVENSFSHEQKISVLQLFLDIASEFNLSSRDDKEKIELALYYYHLISNDFPGYGKVLREIYDLKYHRDILNKNDSYARLHAFLSSYQEMYAEKVFLENEQVSLSGTEFNLKYASALKLLRERQENFIQDVLSCGNKLKNNECKNALEYALSQKAFSPEAVSAHLSAFENALKNKIGPVLTIYIHLIAGLSTVNDEVLLRRYLFQLDNPEFLSKYPNAVVTRYDFQQCLNQSLDDLFAQSPTEVLKLIHEDSFMNIEDKLNFIRRIAVVTLRDVLNKIPEAERKDLEDFISECFKEFYYETIADYMTNVECLSSESTSAEDKFSIYEALVIKRNNLLEFLKQYNFAETQAQYFKSHPDEVSRMNLFCLQVYKVTQLHQNELEAFHSFKERYNQLWQVSRTTTHFFSPQCIAESLAELKEQNAPLLRFLLEKDQSLNEEDKRLYASMTARRQEASFY